MKIVIISMKISFYFLLGACVCRCLCDSGAPAGRKLISQETVDEIRRLNSTWTALDPEKNPLSKYSDAELKRVMGMPGIDIEEYRRTLREHKNKMQAFEKISPTTYSNALGTTTSRSTQARSYTFPTFYDWLTDSPYGSCMPAVEDQGTCGSCYAFSAATVFGVRRCMAEAKASGGTINRIEYSPQDLLSCNIHTKQCDGGIIDLSFKYLEDFGIVTKGCQPYLEGSTRTSGSNSCQPSSCQGGETFTKHYCKVGSSVIVYGKERIKYEILNWGPLATFMTAYGDLSSYGGGVYRHETGESQGGHAVVIVGWGIEKGVEYWKVRNSWGAGWGDGGYFKIAMDDKDSGLGEAGMYCIPEV